MKAITHDDSNSVLIQSGELKVWVDVWRDECGELDATWNKYIFYLTDHEDMAIRKFQDNPDNFENATSIAIEYVEKLNLIK